MAFPRLEHFSLFCPVPKILAIDDSLTIRKLVDIILGGAGHTVLLAEKGAEGLALAKQEKPDLILLDYVLPDMRSTEICQQLLADAETSGIPILLISTNGAAIRQLYADSRNVRDYLTKPFQAKVLQSVVEHILSKRAATEEAPDIAVPATAETVAEPVAGASVPRTAANTQERFAPGAAAAIANDGHATLRALLNTRFRNIAKLIPQLESRRGALSPETFYLPFLLRNELVAEIVAEVSRSHISTDQMRPLIAGTHDWMGIDATFFHLGRTGATGLFSLRTPGETVEVTLMQGRVVMVGSNNPKAYCTGAAFNFRALPPAAIAQAVGAQQREGLPFFVSLWRLGLLRDRPAVASLLRAQGIRAVHRAMTTPGTHYAFVPRESIPDVAKQFPLDVDVRQFVLEVLRRVDDWLEIESTTGPMTTIFTPATLAQAMPPDMDLNSEESAVMGQVNGQRPLQDIAAATGLDVFSVCAAVYRLLKVNLLHVGSAEAPPAAEVDASVESFLQETAPQPWDTSTAASGPTPSS